MCVASMSMCLDLQARTELGLKAKAEQARLTGGAASDLLSTTEYTTGISI